MKENQDFGENVKKIFKELKQEYNKKPDDLGLPIYQCGERIAFLRPISVDLGEQEDLFIKLLAKWRSDNWQAYPTVFKVTEAGTRKWIKSQLIDREDRILFMIVTLSGQPIGHLGLSNINADLQEVEIDNVVRGEDSVLPGIMAATLKTLCDWMFNVVGAKRLFLRVFFDNDRAIKLYERCMFKGVKKIPLTKKVNGETINYEEIKDGEESLVARVFFLMELLKEDYKR